MIVGKAQQYREQIQRETVGTSAHNRTRDYTARDLWLFYLALKPMETKRMQSRKGAIRAGQLTKEVSSIQNGLFNAIFNNSQYPFRVVGVEGKGYKLISVSGENSEQIIKKAYSALIRSAKKEIEGHYGDISSDIVGLNISLSNHNGSVSGIKGDFQKYIAGIFQQVLRGTGNSYDSASILSNDAIRSKARAIKNNPAFSAHLYDILKETIIAALFETSGLSNSEIISSFKDTEDIKKIIKILVSKGRRQDVQMQLGLMAEDLVVQLLQYFQNSTNSVKENARNFITEKIEKTGQNKDSTTYLKIDKKGKKPQKTPTVTRKFFITPDIQIEFSEINSSTGEKMAPKKLSISLKTPSNMDRIIYKSAKAVDGDYWTRIANWNLALQTFAGFSVFNRSANAKFKIFQILSASIASLGIAGTAEHRALITVAMSKGEMTIKSLDAILTEMRDASEKRLTINEVRVRNREAYIENARRIASGRASGDSGPYSTLNPDLIKDEVYQKYADLKELHLNYRLLTKGSKQ